MSQKKVERSMLQIAKKTIGVPNRLKHILPVNTLRIMYNVLFPLI